MTSLPSLPSLPPLPQPTFPPACAGPGADAPVPDAILVLSFGGPEGPADVMPFLENVLRGRPVPKERMLEVAHHYDLFGGVSPINAQNRALIAALKPELESHGIHLPIYFGNRNWHPLLPDALRQMKADGVKHALAFFTSAYSSYSGCRQYRENLAKARAEVGEGAPEISILRKFYNHPGFVLPNAANIKAELAKIPAERRGEGGGTALAFTAHSIPTSMANNSLYTQQLADTCALVAKAAEFSNYALVYQSRSGSPSIPWLDPDILDHLRTLKAQGITDVVISPVGFISDHMEVLYDLDVEARDLAKEIGLNLHRAATVGTHPDFVAMIRELVAERITTSTEKRFLGSRGPSHDVCPLNCCPPPAPPGPPGAAGGGRPAVVGAPQARN